MHAATGAQQIKLARAKKQRQPVPLTTKDHQKSLLQPGKTHLCRTGGCEKNVSGFQIPVQNGLLLAVKIDAALRDVARREQDLAQADVLRLVLQHVQHAAHAELEDDARVFRVEAGADEAHDVFVLQRGQELDLSIKLAHGRLRFAADEQLLHGHFLATW